MFDSLQEIIAHLRRNKLRTTLTGMSVSVGIFLLIVLLGAGNGLIHAFEKNSSGMTMDVVSVYPGRSSLPWDGMPKDRWIQFYMNDLRAMEEKFGDDALYFAAQSSQSGLKAKDGDRSMDITLEGDYPQNKEINAVKIEEGRYVNDIDMRQRRKVGIIGRRSAERIFGTARGAVGRTLRVDSLAFRIVGVYADQGQMGRNTLHVPFTTLQTIFGRSEKLDQIAMKTKGIVTVEENEQLEGKIRRFMAARHNFSPDDKTAIWVNNSSVQLQQSQTGMLYLHRAMWVVGLLTLLSGVAGISNIMLITVRERTHEFGIRKALGAKPWAILRSVLFESTIITSFFGYLGLVAGIAATEYMNYASGKETVTVADMTMTVFLNPTVDLSTALQALLVLIIAGIVAGFFPARKAVKIKPVEALRAN